MLKKDRPRRRRLGTQVGDDQRADILNQVKVCAPLQDANLSAKVCADANLSAKVCAEVSAEPESDDHTMGHSDMNRAPDTT